MFLADRTLFLLERSLDAHLVSQNRLAADVANVDTPGYAPADRGFEAALGEALSGSPEARGIGLGLGLAAAAAPALPPDHDGNAVDLDHTMSELASNAIGYAASARLAGKKLATLRQVISDGAA